MAKHATDKAKSPTKEDKKRAATLEQFEKLTPKALKHIADALEAVVPCSFCDQAGNASKKDEAGLCIKCHGKKVVPDIQQRNWATEEVTSRVAPKPKSQEITLDDKRDATELEKALEAQDDDTINKLAAQLGVVFGDSDK